MVRLRVWPTTIESTIAALERLLDQLPVTEWPNSLVIIDNRKTRVRRATGGMGEFEGIVLTEETHGRSRSHRCGILF